MMNKLSVFIVIIIIALSISSVCAGDSDHNKTDDSIPGELICQLLQILLALV